ncbi:CHAT domain-containing protein [Lentzea flaviverrucosa]|uniref:CHAT domain-containing protein n=1 Tax=Lentzea flaviverrucosa TaxID=200379 RepID=A0A1H9CBH5_9PSEU|nr:CHAT domain-containing protein [Lentzea flaviverrucosa]RDI24503.1 CHAT domain-containing protein [Lentzea flaviverrucosa]SEP98580.1 CHAT domain-containing protein [Lentzea flaviverrucosa]
MSDDLCHEVAQLTELLHLHEDDLDPAVAGATGLALLELRPGEGAVGPEDVERAVGLISFALRHLPHHPCAHLWRYRSAGALTHLAEHHESQELLASALSTLALVAADATAPADVAEWAAVDAAELTKLRLATADFTAEDARLHLDALAAHSSVVHNPYEVLEFRREVALAHRWAYPHTFNLDDLEHSAADLTAVLAELSEEDPTRPEALEALALVQEERHRRGDDPELLDVAVTAAAELRALVTEPPAAAYTRSLVAGLLATRYLERGTTADADEALAEFVAVRDQIELGTEHATQYGVLKCMRGADLGDVAAMSDGVRALTELSATEEGGSAWTSSVLAETHLVLARQAGAEHLWPALDWADATLAEAGEEHDGTIRLRVTRLEAAESAGREFGVHTVLARHDVHGWLTDAERAVLEAPAGTNARLRTHLMIRLALLRTQWMPELARPDDDLGALLSRLCDLAEVVRHDLPANEEEALAGLAAYLTWMSRAYLTGDTPEPLNLEALGPFFDWIGAGKPASEVDEVEGEAIELARALARCVRSGQDFRAFTGDIVALVWRTDALPPSVERDRLRQYVQLLARALGPPSSTEPLIPAELLNSVDGLGAVIHKADALRTAIAGGDVDGALSVHQAIDQAASDALPGSSQEMLARIASGVSRAAMAKMLPARPEALEEAISAADGEWARTGRPESALALGRLLRSRNRPADRAWSRELGLTASVDGEQVTAWCLADDARGDLVRVLETRRAATLDIAPLAFGTDEVRGALQATNADALIYLLPHNKAHGGMAVVVAADGSVGVTPLPKLRTERISRFRTACETLRANIRTAPRRQLWQAELTELCGWAWDAAGVAFEPWQGKRLALVPVGELGLVPWEAAHREVAGVRRFLLQDSEITLVPAARTLAGGTAVIHTGAVIVGNPCKDDPAAAVLAEKLRDDFRPDGVFLGGHGGSPRPWRPSPDGAGTPDEVRTAMVDGLDVLHLGCRATSDLGDPGKSSISLHGGELLPPPADVELVTLTDHVLHGTGHDDARALPARFLANGARHVLAARWAPSHDLLHRVHTLMDGRTPGAALRAAQLELVERSAIDEWTAIAHHGA